MTQTLEQKIFKFQSQLALFRIVSCFMIYFNGRNLVVVEPENVQIELFEILDLADLIRVEIEFFEIATVFESLDFLKWLDFSHHQMLV